MPAYVVVQLSAGHRARAFLARPEVKRLLAHHEARPLDATLDDDALTPLTLAVPDMDRAGALAAALRNQDSVEAAYAKPGEALP